LEEDVYVRLPAGFNIQGKRYGKVLKSIYGLKQAAHDWYQLQHAFIMTHDHRIQQSSVDPCLYYLIEQDLTVLIGVSVDDYVVCSSNELWYTNFFGVFASIFEINDLGVVSHLLQMSVSWTDASVSLGQTRHIDDALLKFGFGAEFKPVDSPMEPGLVLVPATTSMVALPYRELIGALLWIARCTLQ